jgi:hypothetical protein
MNQSLSGVSFLLPGDVGHSQRRHPPDPTFKTLSTAKQKHRGMEGHPVTSTLVAAPDRDAATNFPRYV